MQWQQNWNVTPDADLQLLNLHLYVMDHWPKVPECVRVAREANGNQNHVEETSASFPTTPL